MADTVDVAPNGDIILVLTASDGSLAHFRASSSMLAAASPIFKSMFATDRYAEGTDLNPEMPKFVQLPDDDPEATLVYVQLCHHHQDVLSRLDVTQVRDLAVLVHKYLSGASFGILLEYWMEKEMKEQGSIAELAMLLDTAYLLNIEKAFRELSVEYAKRIQPHTSPPEWAGCPGEVHFRLGEQAASAKFQLASIVEESSRTILRGPRFHEPRCKRLQYAKCRYQDYLSRQFILPTGAFDDKPLLDSIAKIQSLPSTFRCPVDVVDFCGRLTCRKFSKKIPCPLGSSPKLSSVFEKVSGMCLDCLRKKSSVDSSLCKSTHQPCPTQAKATHHEAEEDDSEFL